MHRHTVRTAATGRALCGPDATARLFTKRCIAEKSNVCFNSQAVETGVGPFDAYGHAD